MNQSITSSIGIDKSHGKRRAKMPSTQIDMTPMVDLMSLLITFFMLTTAFTKDKIMEIVLPNPGTGESETLADRTLNILLSDNDRIYYYMGKPPVSLKEEGETRDILQRTGYGKEGLRKILLNRNLPLYNKIDSINDIYKSGSKEIDDESVYSLIKAFKKQDSSGPVVLIKADKKSRYRNIVDVVDEMAICNIARYAIVEPNTFEVNILNNPPL